MKIEGRDAKDILNKIEDYLISEIEENEKLERPLTNILFQFSKRIIALDFCESPIEKIMYLYLEELFVNRGTIIPQYSFEEYNYRVDFYLKLDQDVNIVVECDGHEYHEKTKDQARRDRKRDRKLQQISEVDFVFRFTGSEIYNNPEKCVNEIEDAFIDLGSEKYKKRQGG